MAAEAWLLLAARDMWERVGGPPAYPRSVDRLARYGLLVEVVRLPGLSLSMASDWLRGEGMPAPAAAPDRRLRGLLFAYPGGQFAFLDREDSEAEQRFTLAHEVAHFWLEIEARRRKARRWLGPAVQEVLDGDREPTRAERLQAILTQTDLELHTYLLERDREKGLIRGSILEAEVRADRMALELLAPEEETLRRLPAAAPWPDWIETATEGLMDWSGLPPGPARQYARRLANQCGIGPSIWERLGVVARR
jgi:hypothetical protein